MGQVEALGIGAGLAVTARRWHQCPCPAATSWYPHPRSLLPPTATYQKIVPVAVPQEPLEAGSSYSVTLYISEQAAAMPRARCHSFVAQPGSPQDVLAEKIPRPKNKSVFKKFFGKKE